MGQTNQTIFLTRTVSGPSCKFPRDRFFSFQTGYHEIKALRPAEIETTTFQFYDCLAGAPNSVLQALPRKDGLMELSKFEPLANKRTIFS